MSDFMHAIDGANRWFVDSSLESVLLSLLLAFVLGQGVAWVYAWIAVTLFQLLLVFIAPAFIMPLFNKFIPLEDGELKTIKGDRYSVGYKKCDMDYQYKEHEIKVKEGMSFYIFD